MRNAMLIAGLFVAGCGGGGGGGNPAPISNSTPNASPGGIWKGTESTSGLRILGIVTEAGDFQFVRADGAQYTGKITMSGNSASANFDAIVPPGLVFLDGTRHATGSLTGTIQQRSSFTGNTSTHTDGGTSSNGSITLAFNALYNRPSDIVTIAGNYQDANGLIATVHSDGTIFGQSANTGCVINGAVSIIDKTYNAYALQWTYSSCVGSLAILNGLTANGLGTLDNTVNPEQAVIGATIKSGNAFYAISEVLNRT